MYVDDFMLFFKADEQSLHFLKASLNALYDKAGLTINVQKSNLVLSPNSPRDLKSSIATLFGVPATEKLGIHLGSVC